LVPVNLQVSFHLAALFEERIEGMLDIGEELGDGPAWTRHG